MKNRYTNGQTIIELLLAMAFSLIFLPALFTMFFVSREGKAQQIERTKATTLLAEVQDGLRSIRERGWDQFASYDNGTSYRLVQNGTAWSLLPGTDTISEFSRSIVFSDVWRDATGAIVSSGGTRDPSTRRATVMVSWVRPFFSSVTSVMYLTRHTNIVSTDTTESDFNNGTNTNLRVIALDDGEVVLGSTGGYGDWCTPELTISALDLPKNGVANAISAIQGQIAAGTGDNASGVSYANVLVTDPEFPANPVASLSGTFDGYKTNDVFTEQNYAYLATDTNSKEVAIIDLSQKTTGNKYVEAGYFNAPGNGDANGVTTSGTTGYMIGGAKLYTFDLSQKSGSRPILDVDGVTLPGTGVRLRVRGSRAFIVTSATAAQLVIADVSNPSALAINTQISVPGGAGTGLYVNATGTRAYVTTSSSVSQRELFIVNTEVGSASYGQVIGSYDTGGMDPNGVVVVSGPRAIVVGRNAEEYQVVDITNESASPLPRCGGLEVNTGINGIDTVLTSAGRAYSYIVTGDATTELKIIEGGPGATGHDYVLSGTFVSRIFDVSALASGSAQAVFNRIFATIANPSAQTNVTLQVASADPTGGTCADVPYAYVGPDGTSNTSFSSSDGLTISGAIPFSDDGVGYENPARCFRYRGQFTTGDSTLTPILKDVSVAFSP